MKLCILAVELPRKYLFMRATGNVATYLLRGWDSIPNQFFDQNDFISVLLQEKVDVIDFSDVYAFWQ
tara:strand:+ start:610 stop:810 length:201 start_codon:yes stop_codon:yes gene_type:complete